MTRDDIAHLMNDTAPRLSGWGTEAHFQNFAQALMKLGREACMTKETLKMQNVNIDGVEYAPVTARPTGNRAVVVVDRGWLFCGDVTRENGRIRLSRAVHVFSWEAIGFAKMVETEKADLRPIADVDMPEGAEIFCVPVHEGWGL